MHPKELHIEHNLGDDTVVRMFIECHGFDNEQAFERLKTHEFLGAMIPEAQSIPWNIITTAIERCGRWRAASLVIKKTIDGREYMLSGQSSLSIVLADINIPARPHALYEEWYDKKDRSNLPFVFFTPPQPIIPVKTENIKDLERLKEKYPVSVYGGEEVIWVPNPEAYNFTRHYEELDANMQRVPWTAPIGPLRPCLGPVSIRFGTDAAGGRLAARGLDSCGLARGGSLRARRAGAGARRRRRGRPFPRGDRAALPDRAGLSAGVESPHRLRRRREPQ